MVKTPTVPIIGTSVPDPFTFTFKDPHLDKQSRKTRWPLRTAIFLPYSTDTQIPQSLVFSAPERSVAMAAAREFPTIKAIRSYVIGGVGSGK